MTVNSTSVHLCHPPGLRTHCSYHIWSFCRHCRSNGSNHFCKMKGKSCKESRPEKEQLRKEEEEKEGDEEDALMGRKKLFGKETYHLWALFGFFLVLTVTVVLALAVLVAI